MHWEMMTKEGRLAMNSMEFVVSKPQSLYNADIWLYRGFEVFTAKITFLGMTFVSLRNVVKVIIYSHWDNDTPANSHPFF